MSAVFFVKPQQRLGLLLAVLFCSLSFNVAIYAQTSSQLILSSERGLSSTLIGDVLQDKDGNLWIATENGLNKYNGVTLKTYYHNDNDPHSINSNYIRRIFEDNDGNLLIGTYAGLQIYDPASDSFSLSATLEDNGGDYNLINHIIQRKNGEIWATGNLIVKITIEDGNPIVHPIDLPIPTYVTEEIFEDSKERIWITKDGAGVFRIDPDKSIHKYLTEGRLIPFVLCMIEDRKGNILAGSNGDGVLFYDEKNDKFIPLEGDKCIVGDVMVLNDTETLFCTDGHGMKCYNNITNELTDYNFDTFFPESTRTKLHAITKDRNGNIWLGVYQHGTLMLPEQKNAFNYLGSHSITNNVIGSCCITAVVIGSNGDYYIGTDNDGLYIVSSDKKRSKHLSHEEYPNIPSVIIGLFEDSEHQLWMGSYGSGASVLDLKTMTCRKVEGVLGNDNEIIYNIYDFIEDKQKRVWLATMGGGLHFYDLKTNTIHPCIEINSMVNNWISCIDYSAKTNSLLLGTYDGLWRIGLNNLGTDNHQTLQGSIIHDICESQSGIIWAATSDGLGFWDEKSKGSDTSRMFTYDDGLPSNICYAVEEDQKGNIWISTGLGLAKIDIDKEQFILYYAEDGIQGNEFSKNASAIDSNTGELYFGGVNGLTWFNPADVVNNDHKWEVFISDFYIGGNPITINTESGGKKIIDTQVKNAKHFYLSHKDNSFSIEIGSNDLSASHKKRVQYSMDKKEWITLPKDVNRISFSSLPPGKYSFSMKIIEGEEESDIQTVEIHIRSAWYQTWWAMLLLAAIIIYIIYYLAEQSRHRRILRLRMFHHIQSERQSESKLQFLTNVSHEIRTPMTLIINPLQQLMNTDDDPTRQHSYQLMQRNANRIMSLVNQLMDVRKIDHGQLKLKMHETEMCGYIETLINTFEEAASSQGLTLSFVKDGISSLKAWIDEEQFDKVLMNLLSNALKYTPSGGTITVHLAEKENPQADSLLKHCAEIIVEDSGSGIPERDLDKVFKRFFQAGNKKSGNGTGVGLHLTKSIVKLHHGTIKVENNPDGASGCRFIVQIPLGNSHLKKEEIEEKIEANVLSTETPVKSTANKPISHSIKDDETLAKKTSAEDKCIMIVEDDDEIRTFLKSEFEDIYSEIITCENGVQALEHIYNKMPNIIISDVMMPEMDGFTLVKKIRQNIQFNDIPIILLTAKSLTEDYVKGLEIGADAYLTKPFDMRVLKQNVASLLKSRQTLKNIYSGHQAQEGKVEDLQAKTPDEILMEKVMKVINDNISNPELSVEMISDIVGISRIHLHRKLRQLTNQTTRDLIRNQRITIAAKLLREKKMPIAEVAYAAGFSTPAYFTATFKQMYGMSPSKYMNKGEE